MDHRPRSSDCERNHKDSNSKTMDQEHTLQWFMWIDICCFRTDICNVWKNHGWTMANSKVEWGNLGPTFNPNQTCTLYFFRSASPTASPLSSLPFFPESLMNPKQCTASSCFFNQGAIVPTSNLPLLRDVIWISVGQMWKATKPMGLCRFGPACNNHQKIEKGLTTIFVGCVFYVFWGAAILRKFLKPSLPFPRAAGAHALSSKNWKRWG